ncbi:hypothetical protein SSBR45G_23990 [Bradyrhizobium sp. SSBR45G]|uniref:hypothetical protein n=1 Tax=unclassified Bradyrhizobium TaxID=2631580 RepID=UPI002342A3CC|nr:MULTISPECIES: hypothetical protein [unclassified Bradyrhizobium]GLH77491.1 hypothetical protein SSBR45G_23990 [Bradyrhizobium sp. SSBR45G]GLH84403.1 hypothetical protein SSBR45R_18630 [Bradyrhizobium sp. SSBR45R]
MAAFLDICRFLPSAGGTTDWTYAAAVQGYQSPAAAGAVTGRLYKYRAESADLTQWEIGEGAYTSSTGTLARTTILFTSAGTTAKINFSAAPQVAIVALKEDLISIEEANAFTTTQQSQARANIAAAATPGSWTRTVIASGSGTYTIKAGCRALLVRMVGAGGGGGGGGTGPSGGTGGGGTATVFGSLTAAGGAGGGGAGNAWQSGGAASGGDINIQGGYSMPAPGAGGTSSVYQGAPGGGSMLGFGGAGGWPGQSGGPGTGYGTGGGGGGSANTSAGTGGAGGSGAGGLDKLIVSPAASYSYSVGTAGAGGAAGGGTAAAAGGPGGSGIIIIDEYY